MRAPPPVLGTTRWEWEDKGIRFRLWTRPVVSDYGRAVVPVTLVWRRLDGSGGVAHCAGIIAATAKAARLASATE